jgi:arsenate reductase (glutaredoxin)
MSTLTLNITLYHNPRCSKSREALALLREHAVEPAIVEYLETPPTAEELTRIVAQLGIEPSALVRKGEELFKQRYRDQTLTPEQWVRVLAEHPVLIERPIAVCGDRAVIGRPPQRVLELLRDS